jgi:hypothetical protein
VRRLVLHPMPQASPSVCLATKPPHLPHVCLDTVGDGGIVFLSQRMRNGMAVKKGSRMDAVLVAGEEWMGTFLWPYP